MALTLSTADAALKDAYQDGIREQINNDTPLLAQLEKNTRDIEGRQAVLSLHVFRTGTVGARADGGTLPGFAATGGGSTRGNQGYAAEKVPLKFNYGTIGLTGPTIEAMKSDRGSFIRAIDSETRGVTNDLKRDVNRQSWGTSDGIIAAVSASTNTTAVTIASTNIAALRQCEVGSLVDVVATATPQTPITNGTGRVISGVNTGTGVVSFGTINGLTDPGGNVNVTSANSIVRSGAGGSGANQKEVTGVQSINAASGTLHNVDPTVNTNWVAYVDSNSGTLRSLSEPLMAKTMMNIQIAGGEYPNLIVASDGVYRSYAALLLTMKRAQNVTALKGGWTGLDFSAGGPTVPVVFDRDCPTNQMHFLNTSHLQEYQMSDWSFAQEDGKVLKWDRGIDGYVAVFRKYHEMATDKRNANGLISAVIES